MKTKIKFVISEVQLASIIDIVDTIEAMLGADEAFDDEQKENIASVDKMLGENGFKRKKHNYNS